MKLEPEGKGSNTFPLNLCKKRAIISACSGFCDKEANQGKRCFVCLGRESSQKVSGGQVVIVPEVALGARPRPACRELTYLQGKLCFQNFLRPGQPGWQLQFHSLSFEEHSELDLTF